MDENPNTRRRRGLTGRWAILLAAMLMAVISGCTSSAKFRPASDTQQFPPYQGRVTVLENLPASNQYTRVGVVTVEGVLLSKESNMVAALKDKAAENGANALVMQSQMRVTKLSDGSTRKKLAAWAIRLNK